MNAQTKEDQGSEVVVERKFPIEGGSAQQLDAAVAGLLKVPGVTKAEPLDGRPGVCLRYDARELDAATVLGLLEESGLQPATGVWQRWRIAWLAMLDGNIRDNAAHRPACCSKPPAGAGKGLGGRRH